MSGLLLFFVMVSDVAAQTISFLLQLTAPGFVESDSKLVAHCGGACSDCCRLQAAAACHHGKGEVGDQEDREYHQQTGDILQATQWADEEGVRVVSVV